MSIIRVTHLKRKQQPQFGLRLGNPTFDELHLRIQRVQFDPNRIVVFLIAYEWYCVWLSVYAEALSIAWTTAASHQRLLVPQLAAVCLLILATLTIAARCYASSNHNKLHKAESTLSSARYPLVQFNAIATSTNTTTTTATTIIPITLKSLSPIDDSNHLQYEDQVPHSSNLVLGRLFKNARSHHDQSIVHSDTSIIVINSKKLLHNQNSKRFRTKRVRKSSLSSSSLRLNQPNNNNNNRIVIEDLNQIRNTTTLLNNRRNGDVANNNSNKSDKVLSVEKDETLFVEFEKAAFDRRKGPSGGRLQETERLMPPVHDNGNASSVSVSDLGVFVLILSAIVLTVALGLITCVLSHYRPVAGVGAADGGTATGPHDAAQTPTSAPMLSVVSAGAAAGVGGMDRLRGGRAARELAATRDRQVRLHAVHTDLAINLPPSIAMPDGEEHPFQSRLHVRDPEQESEIHQKCIRPPPNRTVLESESPPPYRSSSAGLLGSSSSSTSSSCGGDWSSGGGNAPLVVRCHSMSSSSSTKRPEAGSSGQKTDFLQRTVKIFTGGSSKKASPHLSTIHQQQTLPVVIVPTRPRRTDPAANATQQQQQHKNKPSV